MKKCTRHSKTTPAQLTNLNPKCAGIDIGAKELYVCIAKNSSDQEVRSFSTFTADIKNMIQWLKENGVKSVAMESTGVYWIVPFEMLEEAGFEVLLANARVLHNVSGRKSDVQDCQWIQQLHSYGLAPASFRPSDDIVRLRAYVRQRSRTFELTGTQVQLMHKALIQMNIQLNHVISDITGATGLNIIRAILSGKRDPVELANLSVGQCRKNITLIQKALEGNYREEHIFALKQAYEAYEFLHKQICDCEKEIEKLLPTIQIELQAPSEGESEVKSEKSEVKNENKKNRKKTAVNRSPYSFDAVETLKNLVGVDLTTIPGIDANIAMKLLSEIGTDMSRWKNAKAFGSWLSLSPANKISGGKVLSRRTNPSTNKAAAALRMAAASLHHAKNALGAFFRRMRSRLGAPKAITALAHKIARILYRMLESGTNYHEPGENYYEQKYKERVFEKLKRLAKEFGCALVPDPALVPQQ